MESIKQKIERIWEDDKFSGQLRNKKGESDIAYEAKQEGESDIGVNFQAYEEKVGKGAKEDDCRWV
jgi:hypothetical protein